MEESRLHGDPAGTGRPLSGGGGRSPRSPGCPPTAGTRGRRRCPRRGPRDRGTPVLPRSQTWEPSSGAEHAGSCSPPPSRPAPRRPLALAAAMFRARRLLPRLFARRALLPPPRARGYAEPAGGPVPMAFTFASPTQVFYNGANVKQVDVPTLTGSFGILASHVPTLQVLKPGVVTVYAEDGTATKYFVSSGSVTVHADSTVQVLAEEAVTMDMLDLVTAKSNLEKAVSEMAAASDEAAKAEAQIKVEANEALVKALE
ncbi:ATP synthase subunit delta, mitochondrial [Falco peregrinus]|uniref:ATP synthase subunit delta, mitochondrial n=1 Tax=Falco peregrinus TaxID=8954 RepID=UPI00247AEC8F|nr:ATP synthase subunit delta, mitochondrial [Falco peregrinus]